ncbi:MAG: hypothetical protein WC139_01140 [Candidatus Kapaibacterium sp.]
MKIILRYIFLITVAGLSFYSISSCNQENPSEPTNKYLGILETDEFGNILGGDYSDWCIHSPVDTFTYIRTFNVTTPQSNISLLRWTTSKEYNCYGFDVERRTTSDTNFFKIGFVNGSGTTIDSVPYVYIDTLQPNHPNFYYRLKLIDIYGNYRYISEIHNIGFPPNAFFGPAYPNPTNGRFYVKFQIPKIDTISLYLTGKTDTLKILTKVILHPGIYELNINNDSNFHNVQKRLHIKCKTIINSDSCSLNGDIQFN